jgi:hypothetical protein
MTEIQDGEGTRLVGADEACLYGTDPVPASAFELMPV